MAATAEQAQKYKDEALNLYKQAQAKMDEYEGKDMPKDVLKQVDDLFEAGKRRADLAEMTQKGVEAQKWQELPNDLKKLDVAEAKNDQATEEKSYDQIFEKYGLKRWEIQGVKDSTKALNNAFVQSREMLVRNDPRYQSKVLERSAATSGATLTPDIFVPQFVNKLYLQSHLRQAGSRIVPLNTDITRYPKMTTASGAASLIAESGAATATNATYGEQAFTAYMFRALQQASVEIVADAEFDLLGEIILPDLAQMFAAAENSYFTVGSGSSQPEGIVNGVAAGSATNAVTVASAASISALNLTFDNLVDIMHKLGPQYRTAPNVGWMMHDQFVAWFRKVKAVSGGTYIWEPSQQVGQPDTIYGRPVYYNQTMTTSVSASTYPIVFGSFDYFWIGDRAGLDVRTANELYIANAQIGYFAFKRVDSHVMQTDAFAILKCT